MPRASEYLLDIDALNGDGHATTVRLGTCGYVTSPADSPADTVYLSALSDPGDFERHLFGEGKTIGSGSQAGAGSIAVANADAELDDWMSFTLDGRPFILRRIDSPQSTYASAEIVQTGVIETLDSSSGMVSFQLVVHDRNKALDRPIQTNRYAGTTTSGAAAVLTEGNADLKDQQKPLRFGKNLNVEPAPVNVYDRIFQVSDGAVTSISPFDGRVALISAGNFASAASLKTALTSSTGIKTGEYGTVLSAGLFGVRFSSNFPLTADVVEGSSNKPGSVARRILERFGLIAGTDFNAASFTALDTAAPFDVGASATDDETCGSVLGRVLASVGAWLAPDELGVFRVGRFLGPAATSVSTITEPEIITGSSTDTVEILGNPDTDGVPVWRVSVTWAPIGTVQDSSQVAACVDDATKSFVAIEKRQAVASNAAVPSLHPQAGELAVETLLTTQADALAVANTLLGLYGVQRRAVRLRMRREDVDFALGDTVKITLSRLGFENGVRMVAIGRRDIRALEQVELIFWG